MKKLLLCLLFPVLIGCTQHSVGIISDKRILITGVVLDAEDNPREAIDLSSFGAEYIKINSRPQKMLGNTTTKNSGEFSLVSLDTNNSFFSLTINNPEAENYRPDLASFYYVDSIGTRNLSYKMGDIYLPEIHNYQISIDNDGGRLDSLFFKILYNNTDRYRFLDRDPFIESYVLENKLQNNGVFIPSEERKEIIFKTLENAEINFLFKFTRKTSYDTINVKLSPENPIYEFSY